MTLKDSPIANLTLTKLSVWALLAVAVISCDSSFMGGNDTKKFNGGESNGNAEGQRGIDSGNGPNGQLGYDPNNLNDPNNPNNPNNIRGDVKVNYGSDDPNLYVPARIYYNGQYSGTDAKFKFYIQRLSPAAESRNREIIQAQGDKVSSENVLEKVCRCGKKSTFDFMWEHTVSGRKGALNNVRYNIDNKSWGDWIVSNTVSDKDWYSGNLRGAPQGMSSMFFGADTENPAAFMGTNREGNGYLRTWYYAPNTGFFGTKDHRWDARDDMRIAITCDVDKCPQDLDGDTEIAFRQHFSHSPTWIKP